MRRGNQRGLGNLRFAVVDVLRMLRDYLPAGCAPIGLDVTAALHLAESRPPVKAQRQAATGWRTWKVARPEGGC